MGIKRDHGKTMSFFLWSAFWINIGFFVISIVSGYPLLIITSLLLSLLIIHVQTRIRIYNSISDLMISRTEEGLSFFQYLKNILHSQDIAYTNERDSSVVKTSVQFSPNPDLSKREVVLHARQRATIKDADFKILTGSSQCKKPLSVRLLNFDIVNPYLPGNSITPGLDAASCTGRFYFSVGEEGHKVWKEGNILLKVPVSMLSQADRTGNLEEVAGKWTTCAAVKGIEIIYDPALATCYTFKEIHTRHNDHFEEYRSLLQLVQKLRIFTGGLPIGIRTGFTSRNEVAGLCRAMQTSGIFVDFITIISQEPSLLKVFPEYAVRETTLSFEEAVSLAARALKKSGLEKEVKIFAAGAIENGFDIIKMVALGASACVSIKPAKFFHRLSEDLFYENTLTSVEHGLLALHKNILKEAVEIMEYAGFTGIDKVNPKMFYRRISPSTIKGFDEIYFRSDLSAYGGIMEDYIHLN